MSKGFVFIKLGEGPDEMTPEDLAEAKAYEEQEKWITENYGKEAAGWANYGWCVDFCGDETIIHTKVYGHGVLTTLVSTLEHEWEDR